MIGMMRSIVNFTVFVLLWTNPASGWKFRMRQSEDDGEPKLKPLQKNQRVLQQRLDVLEETKFSYLEERVSSLEKETQKLRTANDSFEKQLNSLEQENQRLVESNQAVAEELKETKKELQLIKSQDGSTPVRSEEKKRKVKQVGGSSEESEEEEEGSTGDDKSAFLNPLFTSVLPLAVAGYFLFQVNLGKDSETTKNNLSSESLSAYGDDERREIESVQRRSSLGGSSAISSGRRGAQMSGRRVSKLRQSASSKGRKDDWVDKTLLFIPEPDDAAAT